MKKTYRIFAPVVIATGICCLSMNTAYAQLSIQLNTLLTDVFVADIDDGVGSGVGDVLQGQNVSKGESYVGLIASKGDERRTVLTFDLPEIDPNSLTSATLSFHVGITDPGVDFRVYASETKNDARFAKTLFEDASYTLAHTFDPSEVLNTTVTIDVLPLILANYAKDGGNTWVSFRFQAAPGATDVMRLGGFANGGQIPTLTLSHSVPEPSVLALF